MSNVWRDCFARSRFEKILGTTTTFYLFIWLAWYQSVVCWLSGTGSNAKPKKPLTAKCPCSMQKKIAMYFLFLRSYRITRGYSKSTKNITRKTFSLSYGFLTQPDHTMQYEYFIVKWRRGPITHPYWFIMWCFGAQSSYI